MSKISELLNNLDYSVVCGDVSKEASNVCYDTRKVAKGDIFICVSGANFDAHDAISDICKAGAACVVVSKDVNVPDSFEGTIVKTDDTRIALAVVSANFFGNPAKSLKVIGITGTKGKTTTTYLIKSILDNAGIPCGLIGTIETIAGEEHIPSANTTPESYLVQKYFAMMVEAGCKAVVMEVSSQGLMMNRVAGFTFDIGIFTNIEPDHIGPNEHSSFEDYLNCKAKLFTMSRLGIVNGDDSHAEEIISKATCPIVKFGFKEEFDYCAADTNLWTKEGELGVSFKTLVKGGEVINAQVPTPGKFSVYNALTAIAVCKTLNIEDETICNALCRAHVKGRIEMIKVSDKFSLMIDYAHNAMALESLLSTLKEYNPGRLVTLFGCGGNRSRDRRFEMGEVSGNMSDLTVITSDNPRNEEPMDIIADIVTGIKKTKGAYVEIPDRKEAIRYVIKNGRPGDIIVLAGKGHEDYQEIKGVKYHMDERELIEEVLCEESLK